MVIDFQDSFDMIMNSSLDIPLLVLTLLIEKTLAVNSLILKIPEIPV